MKDLGGIETMRIIIKNDDELPEISIGWRAERKDTHKEYGHVVWIQKDSTMETVTKVIKLMVKNMEETMDSLEEKEQV